MPTRGTRKPSRRRGATESTCRGSRRDSDSGLTMVTITPSHFLNNQLDTVWLAE